MSKHKCQNIYELVGSKCEICSIRYWFHYEYHETSCITVDCDSEKVKVEICEDSLDITNVCYYFSNYVNVNDLILFLLDDHEDIKNYPQHV